MQLIWGAGSGLGAPKGMFKLGVDYEYWKNKFGNSSKIAGPGSFAQTSMVRAEYHF